MAFMGLSSTASTAPVRNGVYGKALPSYVPAAVSHESAAASPAGSTANVDTYLVEPSGGLETTSMPGGVARIVDGTRKLFEVRTMQEHVDLMRSLLVRDVAYQAPIIAAYDREDFRVAAYLAKSIAHMTLKPQTVKVAPAGYNMTTVAIDGTVVVSPKRTWLLFPTLLLPDIPIRTTIKLGVRGPLEDGQIEFLDGRWHNLPSAPGFICRLNGFLMGTLMRVAEPVWSQGLWLVGDDSLKNAKSSYKGYYVDESC